MKKYDNYKDSGIEWIGKIPVNWVIKKLKFIAKIHNGQDQKAVLCDNGEYPVYGSGGIFGRANSYLYDKTSVLLGRKGTIDKPQYVEEPFWTVDTSYYTKINLGYSVRYFYYLCTTINFELYKYGSAIPSMTQGHLNEIKFALPNSLEGQEFLANYLDHKTAQIDHLIAKKEQFIKLLEEERIAVINQAVTKGLDPNVQMKDSGVEWLGDMPAHWEVRRLKHIVKSPLKYGANESAEDENLDDPRYIRITDFGKDGKLKDNTFKSLPYSKAEGFLLVEGDVLFARSGATVGKTFLFKGFEGIACFAGYLIKASCDDKIMISDFLYEFTNSGGYENWKDSIFQQSTIQNIGADKYNQLKISVPPLKEQVLIIDYINNKTTEINLIISNSKQEIELLKEYKTALISDVVTGKVDVRDEIQNESING
jgi:type I restriction enzyme S subunit